MGWGVHTETSLPNVMLHSASWLTSAQMFQPCIEEMSIFCQWEEGGSPEEHFFGVSSSEECREYLLCSRGVLERETTLG